MEIRVHICKVANVTQCHASHITAGGWGSSQTLADCLLLCGFSGDIDEKCHLVTEYGTMGIMALGAR